MKIQLIARNSQGVVLNYYGHTEKDALRAFKKEYYLKGWKIEYVDVSYLEQGEHHENI